MKTILRLLVLLFYATCAEAQITSPVARAGFGIDADLRANFFNGIQQSGTDDWFSAPGSFGAGTWVIDTTGAAELVARYATDLNFRKLPFYRTMRLPAYSVVNQKRWIDAVFIRDYHGDDSTMFASGSNKNGMSPEFWTCPVAQSVPDKNEILDMMVHVRRAGAGTTSSDSLWMLGGISIENVTGNRYFDFEMYQTDIYYDRASLRFYGYGPDAGHTSWQFDAAGEVTVPGDIIFTAEYTQNALTYIEARIWVDRAALNITPQGFNWTGTFDGASNGSQFGYAGITPKTAGAFYTGLTSAPNTWAGPFKLVLGDNSVQNNYIAGQFMEFSVNLTKLGLDPVTLLGGDACGMPFRRILVKSRASTSFTASLKDFVGPFDFFLAPRAQALADRPMFCGTVENATVSVSNPVPTSNYTWSTPDGTIVGTNLGPSITVNAPGTYIVTQVLATGCTTYATDTVSLAWDPLCVILSGKLTSFEGNYKNGMVALNWKVNNNQETNSFIIERSADGVEFSPAGELPSLKDQYSASYNFNDNVGELNTPVLYYRLKMISKQGYPAYSRIIRIVLSNGGETGISITPNPVKDQMQLNIVSNGSRNVQVFIYNMAGQLMQSTRTRVSKGFSSISLSGFDQWQRGVYMIKLLLDNEVFTEKIVVAK
ncbi:T9SS type A sorting domain-containing protein [Pseudoflavitalea rhizosphaerae]|uniref:T9SS type A sorting domain-containing protein n=1 Tax=Pseudoflavitalea rhizosphaerae TaxID=1884793 RepID=UPI000F8C87A8|nr:T9SS type A sorting domain-containing protein [Pseudoflavitalea rhizosphaerae]